MYPRIFQSLFHEPWLIDSTTHQAMQSTLLARLNSPDSIFEEKADSRQPKQGTVVNTMFGSYTIEHYKIVGDGIAHITVGGILSKKLSMMESQCGGFDMLQLTHAIDEALKDDEVKAIMLDVDSPGGTVMGTAETGQLIANAAKVKPVYGFTETKAASAAYWLLSQCTHIFTTPSALLGSIGVYVAFSKAEEEIELIKAGKFKAMGAKPLTDKERQIVQERVNQTHAQFKQVVSSKRPVSDEVMEGLVYNGEEAIENGLADSLVLSFDEAIELIN